MINKISCRILYFFVGFLSALLLVSISFPFKEGFTSLDILRYFVFPGVVALFAAMFGAKAGAQSHIKASQEDLAETYLGLMDLVSRDIKENKEIMENVKQKYEELKKQNRDLQPFELNPQLVHTMFFEDIEYPKLRKIISKECIDNIFHIRNIRYVFERWDNIVKRYYETGNYSIYKDGEKEIIKYLTIEDPRINFIKACETAISAIERIKSEISGDVNK